MTGRLVVACSRCGRPVMFFSAAQVERYRKMLFPFKSPDVMDLLQKFSEEFAVRCPLCEESVS